MSAQASKFSVIVMFSVCQAVSLVWLKIYRCTCFCKEKNKGCGVAIIKFNFRSLPREKGKHPPQACVWVSLVSLLLEKKSVGWVYIYIYIAIKAECKKEGKTSTSLRSGPSGASLVSLHLKNGTKQRDPDFNPQDLMSLANFCIRHPHFHNWLRITALDSVEEQSLKAKTLQVGIGLGPCRNFPWRPSGQTYSTYEIAERER